MRDVAVIGTGMTKFGKSDKSQVELFAEASAEALEDANLAPNDIEALSVGNVFGGFSEGQINMAPFLAKEIGLGHVPAIRLEGACSSATVAFREGCIWVGSGLNDIVLVGGTERALIMGTPYATRTFAMGADKFEGDSGLTFPGVFATVAQLYSRKYDIPMDKLREQMAQVSIKNHKHGAKNPLAQFYGKYGDMSVDDVLGSNMISYPLTLMDCCPFSDGAAAAVICSSDIARKFTDEPVEVEGFGLASSGALGREKDYTKQPARVESAERAYDMAGLEPSDIDVLEAHDCFSIAEIVLMEACGFYDWGEASKAVEEGQTDIGGEIPTNVSGGLMGKGHPVGATGVAQVCSVVEQLMGEAPKGNQVDPVPEVGMTDNLGGDFSTLGHLILSRR